MVASLTPRTARPTLFPYTTLFRSRRDDRRARPDARRRDLEVRAPQLAEGRPRLGCSHLRDRKSTRLNSSHTVSSYAVFCLKKKTHATAAARALPTRASPSSKRRAP